ncbi:MAG: hypothetical protein JWQ33_2660 [Ramlibacter sp.]|nr:hypothetical protein [Ramlibacter sp.]
MALKKLARLAVAALALVAATAQAEVINFRFTGTVTYGGYLALAGSRITGTFGYDTKNREPRRKDLPPGYSQEYRHYDIPAPFRLSATVGNHVIETLQLGVTVWNTRNGGNVADMVQVDGYPPIVDGTTYANGAFGLQAASAYDHTDVLRNTQLPRSIDVQQFDSPGMNYGYVQTDGSQTGTLLQFTVDSIEVVPTAP